MGMKIFYRVIFSILILCLIAGCCDDCPVCPTNEMPISDYDIYTAPCGSTFPLSVYNIHELSIVDTLDSPISSESTIYGMSVSGSGNEIIISSTYGTTIQDITSMGTIAEYRFTGQVEVSQFGKYIAVAGPMSGGLSVYILDGTTFEIVCEQSVFNRNVKFSYDEEYFYTADGSNVVRVYDIAGDSLYRTITYIDEYGWHPNIYDAVPNKTGDRVYFLAAYVPFYGQIIGYAPDADTTLLRWLIGPPAGDIRLSPDGREIIATDPGGVATEIFGSYQVIFIDAEADSILALVGPGYQRTNPTGAFLCPGNIAITPDSRYTFVGAAAFGIWGVIDNSRHKFVDVQSRSDLYIEPFFVSCQRQVK